jgi:diaminopimelate epimerase
MLEPVLEDEDLFIGSRDIIKGVFVSMGNPHYVIFTDDVDQVGETGRTLEFHPAFPQRCNIEFARIESDGSIRTRVWERGSGITQACGTGACATAVAAALTGKAGRQSTIVMDGGKLHIEWRKADNHVYMTGPAAFVFDGEVDAGFALNKKE